jgi:hypothetical protein
MAPEEETTDCMSSTASESDEFDTTKDLMVNPFANGLEPIDLSIPFVGLKQVTLTPLTSVGSSLVSPPDIDTFLFLDPFVDLKLSSDVDTESSSSGTSEGPDTLSPRSDSDSISSKFSRLSVFQRICRQEVE